MIRISGDVLVNKYVSLRDGGLNTAAFVAGVVNGVLDAAEFVRTPTHIHSSLQCLITVRANRSSFFSCKPTTIAAVQGVGALRQAQDSDPDQVRARGHRPREAAQGSLKGR